MGAKTYKMTVPVLKKLCDFFAIDRTNSNGKDILVDVLLDFLGEPSETLLKGASGGKATRTDSKSSSKETGKAKKGDDEEVEEAEEDAGEYSDVGDEKVEAAAEGELPSDDALRMWVRAYVRCHNMQNSTLKHALEVAGEKFGVDLTEKKSRLKELLSDEM